MARTNRKFLIVNNKLTNKILTTLTFKSDSINLKYLFQTLGTLL